MVIICLPTSSLTSSPTSCTLSPCCSLHRPSTCLFHLWFPLPGKYFFQLSIRLILSLPSGPTKVPSEWPSLTTHHSLFWGAVLCVAGHIAASLVSSSPSTPVPTCDNEQSFQTLTSVSWEAEVARFKRKPQQSYLFSFSVYLCMHIHTCICLCSPGFPPNISWVLSRI